MGRAKRVADGGMMFHVLNRANARGTIFEKPDDYTAFERVLSEALDRVEMRVLAFCLMPNHCTWCCGPGGKVTSQSSWVG